ncbi:MAG: NAD(P)/FAD-dependent oxidoreductase [Gammaproteobacteria bacterium]|nr:NAD(P)/FAD-dependent oxidoreductase [Gammaproteobacteria bacterium]
MTANRTDLDAQALADAVAIANIPSLLMMLVHMTGELHWLESPFRPSRGRGVTDHDSGGLGEAEQAMVRSAALDAILAWRAGRPLAIAEPDAALRRRMMSVAVAEDIPADYDGIISAELPFARHDEHPRVTVPAGFVAVIVGAGVSGLCAAIHFQRAGIPFEILEKSSELGGVWRDNRYPGAGVDTPNHLYSFTFAPYDWSRYFALRGELKEYLEHVADKFQLRRHIRFNTTLEAADYDAATQRWRLRVTEPDGATVRREANLVIAAVGIFNPIKMPDIAGLEQFQGPCFHTAEWRDDVELTGKRVAIIGNGASCMQTAPAIQHEVGALTIFQRSPHWVAPNAQFGKPIPAPLRLLLKEVPLYRAWYRLRLGWTYGDQIFNALHKDPAWPYPERALNHANDGHRAYFTQYVVSELGERQDLLDKVLPKYPPFGKRMLMDNGWYRMLRNPKVTLVDEPITRITANGVATADGSEYPADVLVIATGFDVLRFLTAFEVHGRSGRSLREVWGDDDARAYLGAAMPDFPNFFCLYGPNLQAGHGGSLIFMIEMQMRYIMDAVTKMLDGGFGALEIRQDVHDAYNEDVDREHQDMVWTHPGMRTYYRNSRGRIVVNSPYRNAAFFEMSREAKLEDFVAEPRILA